MPSRWRPTWITGPGLKSGSAGKSESRGPENGVSRWRQPNSDIYSQNYHFGLKFTTWYINFLAWRQRIISLVCFANNAIHPWPQVMPIFYREMPPGFTPDSCLRRNFVYISNLENGGDKSLDQNFLNIVTPQPLRAPGYCRTPSGRAGGRQGRQAPLTLSRPYFFKDHFQT